MKYPDLQSDIARRVVENPPPPVTLPAGQHEQNPPAPVDDAPDGAAEDPYADVPHPADHEANEQLADADTVHGGPEDSEQKSAIDRRYLQLRGLLLDVDGLRDIPAPTPLVEGYLYRNSLAWLGGKPGHGKTFAAVDLACCVATGHAWHGRTVTRGRVLYLIAEGASGLSLRVDAWALAHGRAVENMRFLPVAVHMMQSVDVGAFAQLLDELKPDLAVLDTQARVTVGAEENSSKDMGRFVDSLEHLRQQSGACVLVVHHEPRNGENLRGSTALEGAATTIMRASKDGEVVELSNPKQKDAPEQPPILLALTPVGASAILSHEAVGIAGFTTESELAVLAVLRDSFGTRGATKTELRDAAGQPKSTWYRSINALVGKGLVRENKEGRSTVYTLPGDNRQTEFPAVPPSPTASGKESPTSHTPIGVGLDGNGTRNHDDEART